MFRVLRGKMAQSTAEYAIIIALVVGAVVAMQTYVKRGIQARVHDEMGGMVNNTSDLGMTDKDKQYEPYYLNSTLTSQVNAETTNVTQTARNPRKEAQSNVSQSSTQTIDRPVSGVNY